MHYSAIYNLFLPGNKEGREEIRVKELDLSPFFFCKAIHHWRVYIAPEEETDKENIDISSFFPS